VNGGDLATNRRDEQETTMLALHLLQNTLVYSPRQNYLYLFAELTRPCLFKASITSNHAP
jgi:TnpA family transposase